VTYREQCTANAQPEYRRQAYERYERLIGYRHYHPQLSLFGRLLGFLRNSHYADENMTPPATLFKRAHQQRYLEKRSLTEHQHKYFFAITLYNSFDIIPDLFSTLLRVCSILGFNNVLISVYENGSTDQTKSLLKLFEIISQAVGLRMVIRTSPRTRGAFHHQIEYMAEIRNLALAPLHELRDVNGEVFDTVIFMVSRWCPRTLTPD
jgi:alpha-1,3-mannosyltransferase